MIPDTPAQKSLSSSSNNEAHFWYELIDEIKEECYLR